VDDRPQLRHLEQQLRNRGCDRICRLVVGVAASAARHDGGGTAPVPGSLVTIAIQWKAPADGDTAHRYALEAQIK
jgi:hypothetical protein